MEWRGWNSCGGGQNKETESGEEWIRTRKRDRIQQILLEQNPKPLPGSSSMTQDPSEPVPANAAPLGLNPINVVVYSIFIVRVQHYTYLYTYN